MLNGKNLEYVDFNHIEIVTPAYFDELKEMRPNIKIRQFDVNTVDIKDNMLRVPLPIKSEGKKKKKKGKKGKKKK